MTEQQKSQRGANLTQADRERGGKVSAAKQVRDSRGKFAGSKSKREREAQHEDQNERRQQQQQAQDDAQESGS